jgi:hypothetical protein
VLVASWVRRCRNSKTYSTRGMVARKSFKELVLNPAGGGNRREPQTATNGAPPDWCLYHLVAWHWVALHNVGEIQANAYKPLLTRPNKGLRNAL